MSSGSYSTTEGIFCFSYLPTGSTENFGGYLAVLAAPYPFSLLLGQVNLYPG